MKILVTGGLGFIGSNLAERLVAEGYEVSALDNLHTGSKDNIESIKDKIKVFELNSGEIEKTGEKYEVIFHQGIYSSSPMYKKDPHLTAKALDEWISILEYARKNDSRIIFASSSSMYNGNKTPFRENMEIKVTDFYTEARYAIERLATLYNDLYSVHSIGLRYFSCYGPHERAKQKFANLLTQFLWQMKTGERPVLFGDGTQTRDFIHVDDVVEANMLALDFPKHDVFNVGTGKSTTLNEVIEKLNKKLGTEIEPVYRENKIKNYVAHTLADTSKAEKKLGFKAKVTLDQGIELLTRCYS